MISKKQTQLILHIIALLFSWAIGITLIVMFYGNFLALTIIGFSFIGLGFIFIYKIIENKVFTEESIIRISKYKDLPYDKNLVKTDRTDEIDYTINARTISQKRY